MSRPLFEYITHPEKSGLSRGQKTVLFFLVVIFHAVLIYSVLTAKFHIKILMLGGQVQNVILVPPIKTSIPSDYKALVGAFPGSEEGQGVSSLASTGGAKPVSEQGGGPAKATRSTQSRTGTMVGGASAGSEQGPSPSPGSEFRLTLPVKPGPLTAKEPEGVTGGVGGTIYRPRPKLRSYALTDYWGRRPGDNSEPGKGDSPGGPLGSPHQLIGSGTGDKVIYRGNASAGARGYDISPWAQVLISAIQRNWVLPPSDEAKASGRVGITIIVDKSGLLSSVRVINSSDNQLLDRTALDAIGRSLPLPRLPDDFPDRMLEAYLVFDYHAQK